MIRVVIETIPHSEHRYPTVGDWWWSEAPGTAEEQLNIRVSALGNWKYEMAVAFHEFREALHCKALGITQEAVDAFDMQFEKDREAGLHEPDDEPGDDPKAPYAVPHHEATYAERNLIRSLGEDWNEYGKAICALDEASK